MFLLGISGCSESEEPVCNAGDLSSIPGSGRFPGEGNGHPLQYSCLGNPMDRGALWPTAHGAAKIRTQLNDWAHTHTQGFNGLKIRGLSLVFQKVVLWHKCLVSFPCTTYVWKAAFATHCLCLELMPSILMVAASAPGSPVPCCCCLLCHHCQGYQDIGHLSHICHFLSHRLSNHKEWRVGGAWVVAPSATSGSWAALVWESSRAPVWRHQFHFHCCPIIYLIVGATVAGRPVVCAVFLAATRFSGMAGRAAAIRGPRLQALPLLSPGSTSLMSSSLPTFRCTGMWNSPGSHALDRETFAVSALLVEDWRGERECLTQSSCWC